MEDSLSKLILAIVLIIAIIEYYRLIGYSIYNEKIIIRRLFRNINISIKQIADIKEIRSLSELHLIRLFGINIGPLARMTGTFWSHKYGLVHLYLTKRGDSLLIILKNKRKYLISPKEEDRELIDTYLKGFKI
ncbi:MAG: hypothetical protein A2X61_03445 [Ignavibacteria bacterium GWB2_35_12]|nr:MAG: hypothetical protein A2X63_10120 [Ignavibacteria bacterium GWA2_35_8]OGU42094.1 MAG: hypothetical protein A2X61_03445 [Ignavibacteria bacterium GWB2_35_12]OGU95576.1 MAG: hypothetical protein A2220_06395 [Ignavibacteria bacterium RIFOXYA2_FULL_35_10]OGV20256.1 MAG: hypothetical protein A2475_07900 [Ignavibacteria bacterium RIFOXYC2_FULL_35_21]